MTQIPGNNVYSQNSGSSTNNAFITVFETRDPTQYDFNYPVQKRWINTVDETEYVLLGFTSTPTATLANWALIGTGGISIHTITGNNALEVGPDNNNNLDFVGDATSINIIGDPDSNTLTANVILPAQYTVLVSDTSSIDGIVPDSVAGTPLCSSGSSANPAYDRSPVVDAITINNAPVNPTDGTNKAYVDLIASGLNFVNTCYASTTANLNATYNNGAAGVGATLTNAGALAAFTTDGTSPAINARILVRLQTTQADNGVYALTTVGDGATPWVLTRTTDYDTAAEILPGDIVPVSDGTLYADTLWIQTDSVTTIGTDPINFNQFGGSPITTVQNSVLLGGPSNTISSLSPIGTAGQILTSNGPGVDPSWQNVASGALSVNTQVFFSSGTYTPSANLVYAVIEAVAGGGSGGNTSSTGSGQGSVGGGGGAGEYRRGTYSAATIGASQSITIGNGGTSGGGGGNTSVGGLITCAGGNGNGTGGVATIGSIAGSSGGTGGSGGSFAVNGGGGGAGIVVIILGLSVGISGAGGNSYFGGGGQGVSGGRSDGASALGWGGGGSGGVNNPSSGGSTGGSGDQGIVIIQEFIQA